MSRDNRSPIERMIDDAVRCVKCNQKIGVCECYDDRPDFDPSMKSHKWHDEQEKAAGGGDE